MNFNFANISSLKTLHIRKWIWVILGCLSLLLRELMNSTPQYVERFYSRGLFQFIRLIFDNSLGLFPIPWIFIFYIVAFYYLFKALKPLFNTIYTWKQRLGHTFFSLLSLTGFLVFWFFTLWGFNYARPLFSQQLGLKIEKPDSLGLEKELKIAAQEAILAKDSFVKINWRERIHLFQQRQEQGKNYTPKYDTYSITPFNVDEKLEVKTRQAVRNLLRNKGFPASTGLRGRSLYPEGILFGLGISGIYMPFVGESNIDNGLHHWEKPFSMAHEMAHGYGWTEEATANFIAYLACIQSDDAFIRYSGYLMYYRYVASNYIRLNPEGYKQFRETLPESIKVDLKAIAMRQQGFKTWFDTESLNNIYLKSQGVQGGTMSYSRVVVLVYSWRKSLPLQ
jgi:hypothetical protein